MELFLRPEKGRALRSLLDGIAYEPRTPKWQYDKPHDPAFPERRIAVDLLSRLPFDDEPVRADQQRVGGKSGTELHGRTTPEAFAIEDQPQPITISGNKSNGESVSTRVFIPHPYASLQMKIKAAQDWYERRERGEYKPFSEKHVFDVYILVAMLTEKELEECASLAINHNGNVMAKNHSRYAETLFGTDGALGFIEAAQQARQGGSEIRQHYPVFIEALRVAIGSPV